MKWYHKVFFVAVFVVVTIGVAATNKDPERRFGAGSLAVGATVGVIAAGGAVVGAWGLFSNRASDEDYDYCDPETRQY